MNIIYNTLDMDHEDHVELFMGSYIGDSNQPLPDGFEDIDFSETRLPAMIEDGFHRHLVVYHPSSQLSSLVPPPSMFFKDYGFSGYQVSVWTLTNPVLPNAVKSENLFFMIQESLRNAVNGKVVDSIPSPWIHSAQYSTHTWKLASLRSELFLNKIWNKTMAPEFSARGGKSLSAKKIEAVQKNVIIAQVEKQERYTSTADVLVRSGVTACELAVREKITFRAAVERLKRAYKKSDEAYDGSITSFDAEKYARMDDGKVVPLLGTQMSLEESIEELYYGSTKVTEVELGSN